MLSEKALVERCLNIPSSVEQDGAAKKIVCLSKNQKH
jgi:hypothetical protein